MFDLIIKNAKIYEGTGAPAYMGNVAVSDGKIAIYISHRLSAARRADRVYMMENGRVIEKGTHEQLIQLNGKYAEMWRMQAEKYVESGVEQ